MSGERLSGSTRALLKGARADAPSAAARAKVWGGVSAAVGGVAGVGAAGAGASGLGTSGAGMGAAKLLVTGTLLGGAFTVGLAAMLLHFGPSPGRTPPASLAATVAATVVAAPEPELQLPPAPATSLDPGPGPGMNGARGGPADDASHAIANGLPRATQAAPRHGGTSRPPRAGIPASARRPSADDSLTREASLVASARAALSSGNAEEALRLVRSARSMPSPQLVPEELTVEAQALRSLGKADDARSVDATLHSQYPDSALAR
jgi:hypothetical protein